MGISMNIENKMEKLLTNKTVSITEFRDPGKVIANAGGKAVAILNRNKVVGYFVPVDAVEKVSFEITDANEVSRILEKRNKIISPVLKYLEDK